MQKKIKTMYNGNSMVSQYGSVSGLQTSENDFVKCLHIETSLFKTNTIKVKNYSSTAALTYKLLGYVDAFSQAPETIMQADIESNSEPKIMDAQAVNQYAKVELYIKSKIENTPAKYSWEFFSTVRR